MSAEQPNTDGFQHDYELKTQLDNLARQMFNMNPESYDRVMALEQERDQLTARVSELEKALTNIKERVWWRLSGAEQHILTEAELKDIQKQCDVLSTPPSSALTRLQELENNANSWWEVLEMIPKGTAGTTDGEKVKSHLQELERKAKALDWLDANRSNHIYDHFKYNSSNAANCKTWLSAIENAMEKQK